jgi:hypothetical protein
MIAPRLPFSRQLWFQSVSFLLLVGYRARCSQLVDNSPVAPDQGFLNAGN